MKTHEKWMPLYVADYLASTTRLTLEQHGAYMLLIMDYWRNGPPPDDPVVLARIVGATAQQWDAIASGLHDHFQVVGGKWMHNRIEQELGRARKISELRAEAGAIGLAKREANKMQLHTPSPSPSHITATKTKTKDKSVSPEPAAGRSAPPIGDGDLVARLPSIKGDVEIRKSFVAELMDVYPGVMVAQEIDKARLWLLANPTKRKTNVRRFLTSWVARQQERA